MNEDSYLDAYYEDANFLEPLDGYGDDLDWEGDDFEGEWDDEPDIYGGEYSEE